RDMAGTSKHELHGSVEHLHATEDRRGRCDVVFARGNGKDGKLDILEVELDATDYHFALGQAVLVIKLAQIKLVICGRHPRRVLVPEQQIEWKRLLAQHVIVDDVRPDEV